jgi:hypothetical protein
MKKLRLILLSAAVLLATGAVMATAKPTVDCDNRVNYYKVGDKFYYAGVHGVDFLCTYDPFGVCTYYYDAAAGVYKPCRNGQFRWFPED